MRWPGLRRSVPGENPAHGEARSTAGALRQGQGRARGGRRPDIRGEDPSVSVVTPIDVDALKRLQRLQSEIAELRLERARLRDENDALRRDREELRAIRWMWLCDQRMERECD